jgi:RNase H-like domain found in reverse transcriptase
MKSYSDSGTTNSAPVEINVLFTRTPSNTSDIFYLLTDLRWISTKPKLFWIGPNPKKSGTQSFLAFANFYRCFIFNFSDLTVPLTHLTCKGTPWVFSESCWTSFESLKEAFTSAPVLAKWNPGAPLIVETDTSDYALGAILSTIDQTDNQIHPITFHYWTFTPPELNYDVHDKELLAIFEAFKAWRLMSL